RSSLTNFVFDNKEATKAYVQQFDTESQAKKSIESKFILAFNNFFPNRKRITGKTVDIGVLYSEAKLEKTIRIE
ncbi:hypothetical protein CLU79DRAFT_674794, partial [Phycomyces nitens]